MSQPGPCRYWRVVVVLAGLVSLAALVARPEYLYFHGGYDLLPWIWFAYPGSLVLAALVSSRRGMAVIAVPLSWLAMAALAGSGLRGDPRDHVLGALVAVIGMLAFWVAPVSAALPWKLQRSGRFAQSGVALSLMLVHVGIILIYRRAPDLDIIPGPYLAGPRLGSGWHHYLAAGLLFVAALALFRCPAGRLPAEGGSDEGR